ncbi:MULTISPECIES: hypothetical protein [Bradyrhizobium]|uniref:Uncharacterized protein n=1 Tax=Bradyrhizobium barranii subsp. barranii TaxID=2823807 RepID=A0A7Z0QNS0_9BRAD|nr:MULTISPECIES: hypothetical protein [Bradyrhizobium]UGX89577.1 hypothetical protein G6321_00002155 [Bradyrhizobium barranii subsp. barranii]UQD86116.1 hypothetical protein JEY66_44620 [Bradyrhizobium elkanii USDA 76]
MPFATDFVDQLALPAGLHSFRQRASASGRRIAFSSPSIRFCAAMKALGVRHDEAGRGRHHQLLLRLAMTDQFNNSATNSLSASFKR